MNITLSLSRRQDDKSFSTDNVPLTLKEKGLVVLVTNSNVKHCVGDGEYRMRRDRCYAACKKMDKQTLRQVTLEEIEGNLYNVLFVLMKCYQL